MIKELDYQNSREYLGKFQYFEKSYEADWYDCEDEKATYIWWIEVEVTDEKPLGFLSYKQMISPNRVDFIYIVKIYVLHTHRGQEASLIDGERVSMILFRELVKKEVNILTLESACKDLDKYYETLGFMYIKDVNFEFTSIIGTEEKIMIKIQDRRLLSENEQQIFGRIV